MRIFSTFAALFSIASCLSLTFAAALASPVDAPSEKQFYEAAQNWQWKKILFYVPTWFRGEVSLVDDDRFFIHPRGKTHPELEIAETWKAFTEGTPASRQEALCKYPARRKFLEASFQKVFEDTDPQNGSEVCKRYRVFSERVYSESVSLIFSSYFPGSPGSLFGHTLLKFKRKSTAEGTANALLDFGLNHAAYPSTYNPILYPVMGIGGMFPGMLSMMPYYVKVQEYNNAESRDLWEYDLNLDRQEVAMMLASVFELSTHRIDYFYFDDNCSYLMLALMDVARPSLNLVSKFRAWVIPGDTVRVVAGIPSLVDKIHFRPSNVRKYLNLENSLNDTERRSFNELMFGGRGQAAETQKVNPSQLNPDAMGALERQGQIRVLDTAIEYIDASERLTASDKPAKWKNERDDLIKMRAELRTPSESLSVPVPEIEAPHTAYPPTRLSFGVVNSAQGQKRNSAALLFGWRPALHTLDNPIAGMGADLGVGFFNLEFLMHGRSLSLREFTPLSIEAIPLQRPHLRSVSWSMDIGYLQRCFKSCAQTSINAEIGFAFPAGSPEGRLALRGGMRLGGDEFRGLFIEPSVIAIANIPIKARSRWLNRMTLGRIFSRNHAARWMIDGLTSFVYRPASPWELQVGARLHNQEHQLMGRMLYYF